MATVLHAEAVEGADKLLRLRVDIGSEQRTIFAGIGQSYRPEDLIGKQVIVVANLQPARCALASARACYSPLALTVLMWWWRNLASDGNRVSGCARVV